MPQFGHHWFMLLRRQRLVCLFFLVTAIAGGCFDAVLRPRILAPTMRRACFGGIEFQRTLTDDRLSVTAYRWHYIPQTNAAHFRSWPI